MPVRHADPQALARGAPAMAARHVGRGPGLVDEDEARGIEIELGVEPGLAPLQDVGTVLLAGMGGLFLRVIRGARRSAGSCRSRTRGPARQGPRAAPRW